MDVNEQKQVSNASARLLIEQSIGGKMVVIGEGMKRVHTKETPYLILDEAPVFHMKFNKPEFEYPDFIRTKVHKWGQFFWPFMGLPEVGADIKLYVDCRVPGWYIMWTGIKMEEWQIGPNDWDFYRCAWTPRRKGENLTSAGFRLFWAVALQIAWEEKDVIYSNFFNVFNYSTINCKLVAATMGWHIHQEQEFQELYDLAPDWMKPHMLYNRKIKSKKS